MQKIPLSRIPTFLNEKCKNIVLARFRSLQSIRFLSLSVEIKPNANTTRRLLQKTVQSKRCRAPDLTLILAEFIFIFFTCVKK